MGSHAEAAQCRNLILGVFLRNESWTFKKILLSDSFQTATRKPKSTDLTSAALESAFHCLGISEDFHFRMQCTPKRKCRIDSALKDSARKGSRGREEFLPPFNTALTRKSTKCAPALGLPRQNPAFRCSALSNPCSAH